ncbi:nucleotide-binding universal stress UspA family protein [Rhizorhapis suberifaciens]|uniref:Nucleotide-binding universal stress UspA family protein n=2 Tax=Rhizorhapis suberifaciens TaxID=13656 RepID=A0A840HUY2_9SPHN|nr:nucleotide-binding universal stress UspA family protein [Rhizorhapis suberifaciens]
MAQIPAVSGLEFAQMRTYLVVVDETKEAGVALRFAARRAAKTGGAVQIVALVPPPEFVQWGGVQATIEEEAHQRAEALVAGAAGSLVEETGIRPSITVRAGDPVQIVRKMLMEDDKIAALVLGAAATGAPGPLVNHFAGNDAGSLPCPVMIIPGSLSREAIDRLS